MNSRVTQAEMARQRLGSASDSVHGEKNGSTLVLSLNCRRRPSTIRGLVSPLVINAVNGMLRRWSVAHVGIEGFERRKPSLAHSNAPCAVSMKSLLCHAVATLSYVTPSLELWRRGHAVRRGAFFQLFDAKASTGIRSLEVVALHDGFVAAIAPAAVLRMLRILLRIAVFHNGETAEALSSQVNSFRHLDNILQASS